MNTYTYRLIISLLMFLSAGFAQTAAQTTSATQEQAIIDPIDSYLKQYTSPDVKLVRLVTDSVRIYKTEKELHIYLNERIGYQPMRTDNYQRLYNEIAAVIPSTYKNYKLHLYAGKKDMQRLIPNFYQEQKDISRLSYNKEYKDNAWVRNASRAYVPSKGLENKHIALWQSHGYMYDIKRKEWRWQRPRLYTTNEDQFTQSIIIPYLIPMLQNAGAIVFTPRERDIQRNEVIVDNDGMPFSNSRYKEIERGKHSWMRSDSAGFSHQQRAYVHGENPFKMGTAKYVPTEKKGAEAVAQWEPDIPEAGEYAVYVSYQSLPNSVSDAKYTVHHRGGSTEFYVNQQMGGGTWVYLGTFFFNQGLSEQQAMVELCNHSTEDGVVTADAVRFGGGMGNISRRGKISLMPRYLEGARYWAQWAGMNDSIYSPTDNTNDYNDDINARSKMINYLSGGSIFNPNEVGQKVPFEAVFSIHSDSGILNDSIFGTMGIYTTNFNDGKLASGTDRLASRDLVDLIQSQIVSDMKQLYHMPWQRRAMWDRNYSETRLPVIPSAIIETLSHQNFTDMAYALDPQVKFNLARAVYKAVLRFVTTQHKQDYVVQPLPVSHFQIDFDKEHTNMVHLSWQPVADPLEPEAMPEGYIVYTRTGKRPESNGTFSGFDNGRYVCGTNVELLLEPGIPYSFKITAVNKGGESMPSEILSAFKSTNEQAKILIVNNFCRTSGPAVVNTAFNQGFEVESDPGVPYMYDISLAGRQVQMSKSARKNQRGDTDNYYEGRAYGGNTFDYPSIHGAAIQEAGTYSYTSCSANALTDKQISAMEYDVVDLIMGMEKNDGGIHSLNAFKTFKPALQQLLRDYTKQGGRLLVSGAFIGSDMCQNAIDASFTSDILKYKFGAMHRVPNSSIEISGMGRNARIPARVNSQSYAVSSSDIISAEAPAFTAMVYADTNQSAAVAYKGDDYRSFSMAVPFESINSFEERCHIMASILRFLTAR